MKSVLDRLRTHWTNPLNNKVFIDAHWPPQENYYEWYALYATLVQPMSILEIGVAYGWSTTAMIAGWPGVKDITLVDSEMYGIPLSEAEQHINRCCLANGWTVPKLTLLKGDSRSVEIPTPLGGFDLIHVDGEHSKDAVVSDVRRALTMLSSRGVIVADDVTGIKVLGEALQQHVLKGQPNLYAITIPTYTGHLIIQRRAA